MLLSPASAAPDTSSLRSRSHNTTGVCTCHVDAIDYCNAILAGVPQSTLKPLQRVQNAAARLVHQLNVRDHVTPSLIALHWLPIRCRIDYKLCMIMADVRRISKTSSVRPAAQQHVYSLACDRLAVASTRRHRCEPSLLNAPDLLHGIYCLRTSCSRNYLRRIFNIAFPTC